MALLGSLGHRPAVRKVIIKKCVDFTWSETYQIKRDGTDSKPNKCPYPSCNFTHYDRWKLQAHYKKAHENIKPFECKVCGSSYVQLKDVCVHIATKHENWSKEYANANFRFAHCRTTVHIVNIITSIFITEYAFLNFYLYVKWEMVI